MVRKIEKKRERKREREKRERVTGGSGEDDKGKGRARKKLLSLIMFTQQGFLPHLNSINIWTGLLLGRQQYSSKSCGK